MNLESFELYSVDPETRVVATLPAARLLDDGKGGDTTANDLIFSTVILIESHGPGETFAYRAVPIIGGIPTDPSSSSSSSLVMTNLNTIRSYEFSSEICQVRCAGITKDPVSLNGGDLRTAIIEYMADPNSSKYGSVIDCWAMSGVTSLSYAFAEISSFNEAIECWDTSGVVTMEGMFLWCQSI